MTHATDVLETITNTVSTLPIPEDAAVFAEYTPLTSGPQARVGIHLDATTPQEQVDALLALILDPDGLQQSGTTRWVEGLYAPDDRTPVVVTVFLPEARR